eukprot:11689513-Karenia_brevis.AAC.1
MMMMMMMMMTMTRIHFGSRIKGVPCTFLPTLNMNDPYRFHESWKTDGVELVAERAGAQVKHRKYGTSSSWKYRFAILQQPLSCKFAVKVEPMDGKIGSNRALEIGVTSSVPHQLNMKQVVKAPNVNKALLH